MTTHLIIQNNEETIEETLNSILPLNSKIIIGNIGSTDKTPEICKKYNAEIVRLSLNNDLSQVRNTLITDGWNLYIEPWETLITGQEEILNPVNEVLRCNIIQNNNITKSIRLWNKKLKFKYPVYETLFCPDAKESGIYIHAKPIDNLERNLKIINNWKKTSPLALEPYYYSACILLIKKEWKEFINVANYFIFQEKKQTMAVIMTKYYLAGVYFHIEKNYQKAINLLLTCLIIKPLMAEFWCLLADIYYNIDQYDKAICFYENAIILGNRRLNSDEWPFEITKYKEYPQTMIDSCKNIQKNINKYIRKGHLDDSQQP